ncbi:MAG: hypothetical protein KG029_02880 [Bacteroidetes bacterium]|jgi:hypothetical protein|nr:hypothetical protein [Bacteroidota bacterium]
MEKLNRLTGVSDSKWVNAAKADAMVYGLFEQLINSVLNRQESASNTRWRIKRQSMAVI